MACPPSSELTAGPPHARPAPLQRAAVLLTWLLALFNLYYFRIADPDLWWYLQCGDDILRTGQIHQADQYSFTAAGLPYLNHEWLTQVLLAAAFKRAGETGLVAVKMAVGACFLWVVWCTLRLQTEELRLRLPAFLLVAHVVGRFHQFRPQIFTFLLLATLLLILEQERRRPNRWLWAIPALLCLWANVHAAFASGIALLGYYWLFVPQRQDGRGSLRGRRLGAVLLIAILATLLNPHGVQLWEYVAREAANPLNKLYVDEWKPTPLVPPDWNGIVFLLTLALVALPLACARPREWEFVTLAAIFAALGFSAPRHIPLFAIVAVPPAIRAASRWLPAAVPSRRKNLLLAGATGLVLVPALLTAWFTAQSPTPRVRIFDEHYKGFPYEAAEFLRQQPAEGNLWNELAWGGYLLWKLHPQWKVSLDGRNITLYPAEVVREHFEFYSNRPPGLEMLQSHGVDVCLVGPHRSVARLLEEDAGWEKVFEDRVALVFLNRHSRLVGRMDSTVRVAPRPRPLYLDDLRPKVREP